MSARENKSTQKFTHLKIPTRMKLRIIRMNILYLKAFYWQTLHKNHNKGSYLTFSSLNIGDVTL